MCINTSKNGDYVFVKYIMTVEYSVCLLSCLDRCRRPDSLVKTTPILTASFAGLCLWRPRRHHDAMPPHFVEPYCVYIIRCIFEEKKHEKKNGGWGRNAGGKLSLMTVVDSFSPSSFAHVDRTNRLIHSKTKFTIENLNGWKKYRKISFIGSGRKARNM